MGKPFVELGRRETAFSVDAFLKCGNPLLGHTPTCARVNASRALSAAAPCAKDTSGNDTCKASELVFNFPL